MSEAAGFGPTLHPSVKILKPVFLSIIIFIRGPTKNMLCIIVCPNCWLVFCMVTFGFKKSMTDFQSFRTCFSVKITPNLEMMHKKQQSEVGTIHYMKISQKIKSFRDDINSFITFAIHDICLNYSLVSQQDLVCK